MMVDFGQRLERKQLWEEMEKQHSVMTDGAVPSFVKLGNQVRKYTDQMKEIFVSNDQQENKMTSDENVLFRKLSDRAIR